jgi:hypothetical protein
MIFLPLALESMTVTLIWTIFRFLFFLLSSRGGIFICHKIREAINMRHGMAQYYFNSQLFFCFVISYPRVPTPITGKYTDTNTGS